MTTVVEQTPDEWLLERFDKNEGYPWHRMWQRRPMFQVLNDHERAECGTNCWSGEASWPQPAIGRDLLSGVLGSRNTAYRELMLQGEDE